MTIFIPRVMSAALAICLSSATALCAAPATTAPAAKSPSTSTIWCLGKSLLPAWGFYRGGEVYEGTRPIDESCAWNPGDSKSVLTWVAEFPSQGTYDVWIRRYRGYGDFEITIDEIPVTGGRGFSETRGGYVWSHIGQVLVRAGRHHVDIDVSHGFLDAILFTTESRLDPRRDSLPMPVADPQVDLPRAYRNDASLANEAGFVAGAVTPYAVYHYDWMPRKDELATELRLWGGIDQYVAGTFSVRALADAEEFRATVSELTGPRDEKISADEIDLRVIQVRSRRIHALNASGSRMMPQLLLRDDRNGTFPPKGKQGGFGGTECVARIPAHESRQFWLTVHVRRGASIGTYSGTLTLSVANDPKRRVQLPLKLEVLDVDLKPADGYFAICHTAQPLDPNVSSYGDNNYVSPQRYLAELKDMVRHGLNTTTMYSSIGQLRYLQEAGMTRTPCLMAFPRGHHKEEIAAAQAAGFDGVLHYGYDEPAGERVAQCRREAISRHEQGLSMMCAINSLEAFESLWDVVDHPIYSMVAFGDPRSPRIARVKEKGFYPISYWTVGPTYPVASRAWAGPYNRACGFVGSSCWAYQDFQDNRMYAGDDPHGVAYPDESGDPIPTLAWEAHRDGIDDLRYRQSLERAIATAEQSRARGAVNHALDSALTEAKDLLRRYDDSLQLPSWRYLCTSNPSDLENFRHAMENAIIALRKVIAP